MNKYDLLVGNVEKLVSASKVSGNQENVSTTHSVICEVDGQPVRINCNNVSYLYGGDKVFIVGNIKNRILEATSFRNIDKKVVMYGKTSSFNRIVFCYLFSVIPPICIGGWYCWYQNNIEREKDRILDSYENYI